jgi:membrane protein
MIIKGYNVVPLVKQTFSEIREDRLPSLAAQTAYYFFFSLFPLLLFLTPLLGLLGNGRRMMEALFTHLATTMPSDTISLLRRTFGEIVSSSGGPGIMSIGLLLAAWSGSSIFGALMQALNVAYDVSETRPWWKQMLIRLAALGVAGVVVICATVVFLDGDRIALWASHALQLGGAAMAAIMMAEVVFAVALLVVTAAFLYKLLPDIRQRWSHVLVSAGITTVLWILATLIFRLYVQHFGSYNKTYGAIGGVILLLTWMYYTMFVVLVGGELASEIHHGTGAVDPERGAIYLGRVVTEAGPGRATMDLKKQRD